MIVRKISSDYYSDYSSARVNYVIIYFEAMCKKNYLCHLRETVVMASAFRIPR